MLATHPGLSNGTRLPALASAGASATRGEWIALALLGAAAALAAAFIDFGVRVPGHAILRSVLPMGLGLALVPRRGAGSVMGLAALATALGLRGTGAASLGMGATTSLCLAGPFLDLALTSARGGWRIYWGCGAAGMASNLAALAVRGGGKLAGVGGGSRPIDDWWSQAWFTYPACGLVAGLVSAAVWFQFRPRRTALPDAGSAESAA
jgi:hypothetical protein